MCRSEADKIIQNKGLVPIESGGKRSRAAVWVSEKGSESCIRIWVRKELMM